MKQAVFLDRDGVINEDGNYIYQIKDFHFLPGIFSFCREAQKKGYLLIVATNQSGIARGYYTEKDFFCLNDWMLSRFRKEGISICKVYYCPFHPEKGMGKYRKDSYNRKPNPGMLLRAQADFRINMEHSLLIGDRDSDMQAGHSAGIGTLLLLAGKYQFTAAQDIHIIEHLADAIKFL